MAEKKTTTTKKVAKKATTTKTTAKKAVKKTTTKKKVAPKKTVVTKKTTPKKTTAKKKVVTKKTTTKPAVAKKVVKKTAIKKPAKKSEMGLWSRFWRVFTPTFLTKLGQQKSQGKSWGFWFLSNFLLVLVPAVASLIFFNFSFFADFPNNLIEKIPVDAQIQLETGETYNVHDLIDNFELSIDSSGKLSSKNMPDPLIMTSTKGENGDELAFYTNFDNINENKVDGVLALDTKDVLGLDNLDKNFANFAYIMSDKIIMYDGRKHKTQAMPFKEIFQNEEVTDFPKIINKESLKEVKPFLKVFLTSMVIMMAIGFYIFLAIFRLINALFWALIFWAVGAIAQVKNWDFEKSFMAMLHFSFVSMLFLPLAFVFNLSVFSYAAIVFAILFGMNFWEMEKK